MVSVFKNYFLFLRTKKTLKTRLVKGTIFVFHVSHPLKMLLCREKKNLFCLFFVLFREQKRHICSLCFSQSSSPYSHIPYCWNPHDLVLIIFLLKKNILMHSTFQQNNKPIYNKLIILLIRLQFPLD